MLRKLLESSSVSFALTPSINALLSTIELKKEILDQRVKDGVLTREEADEIYEDLKNNIANYDMNGYGCAGGQSGKVFGKGSGEFGRGCGNGRGFGFGQGNGVRSGRRN